MKKILNLVGITDNLTVQKIILSKSCWDLIHGVPIALIVPRFRRRVAFLTCTIGIAGVYVSNKTENLLKPCVPLAWDKELLEYIGPRPLTNFLSCKQTVWTIASARYAIHPTPSAGIAVLVFIFVYSP